MARFAGTALTDYFSTPDFTQIGGTNMKGQSLQRNAATKAEGLVHGAGINSMAQVASAGFKADAITAGAEAQGQASMASGIGNMVSGIAGGFGARGSGGGDKYGFDPYGSQGNPYGGTGGRIPLNAQLINYIKVEYK